MAASAHAHTFSSYDPVQLIGTVTQIHPGGRCTVRCDARDWEVPRAASCLLAPQTGDTALICGPDASQVYLIAIITQVAPLAARIDTPGSLVIAAAQGSVTLEAGESVALRGARHTSLETAELDIQAGKGRVTVQDMDYLGMGLRASLGSLRVVGRSCEVVMDRISQLARHIFRLAEDTEQVRAGRIDQQAEQTVRVHARHTLVTGKDLVKVDADQIHMG